MTNKPNNEKTEELIVIEPDRRGRKKLDKDIKRIIISLSVSPISLKKLDIMAKKTGKTRGKVFDDIMDLMPEE